MIGPTCDRRSADWLVPFQVLFTRPTWWRVRVLVEGAILTPHRRTISAALRATGKSADAGFALYHAVLNRCRWSALAAARILFLMLVGRFAASRPVVIGLDDTIERRWGAKIKARGIYRDPVRSSHGHFVKASGLRWLSAMLLAPVPWAEEAWGRGLRSRSGKPPQGGRIWALPFFTVLMASERAAAVRGVRHKTLVDGARQMILQIARWLPGRSIVVVVDSALSAIDLLAAVRTRVSVVTRLRLDARLFAPAAPRETGTIGRPRRNGERLPTLAQRLLDPQMTWKTLIVQGWYGGTERRVEVATGVAVWSQPGRPIVPLRWLLVRAPVGLFRPQAFLCTDQGASPDDILSWFVRRWTIEVTFAEVRRHLGVETQRQWSDRAIARTTPVLLGLSALVTVWADDLHRSQALVVRSDRWYRKTSLTFADAIAAVRRQIWAEAAFTTSPARTNLPKIPGHIYDSLADLACYAA